MLKLREHRNYGFLDPDVLEAFPELKGYSDQALCRTPTGHSPESNRPTRRHGRHGGVARRLRRLTRSGRLTLPIVFFLTSSHWKNKMYEIQARISIQKDMWDCSILCFYETWLKERTPDEAVALDGYMVVRGNRRAEDSGKTRRGMAAFVKQSWCTDCKILLKSCSENVKYKTEAILFAQRIAMHHYECCVHPLSVKKSLHWGTYTTWSVYINIHILIQLLSLPEISTNATSVKPWEKCTSLWTLPHGEIQYWSTATAVLKVSF